MGENNFLIKVLLKKLSGLSGITKGLIDYYHELYPVILKNKKTLVAHDAVNKDRFNAVSISKEEARKEINFPKEIFHKKIVTYVGSIGLYNWKGVDTFVLAAKYVEDVVFLVVGGKKEEIENLKKQVPDLTPNVFFVGHQKQEMTPVFRRASDCLVIPNKAGNLISERFTSPIKLFSNMASNIPIIASDLPSLREVLNEGNSTFFEASNEQDLAEKIKFVFQNYELELKKANKAYKDVDDYTYAKRASKIFNFVLNSI